MRPPGFLQTKVERLQNSGDIAGLIAILNDHAEKTYERAHAAKALADLAERLGASRADAIAALLPAADEPTEVRKWALLALAELHEPTALPAFRRAARDDDWMIRIFAAHGFDRLHDGDTVVEVVRLLGDRESGVREAAAAALGSLGDGRVRPLLESASRTDPYRWVREAAEDALDALERA